MKRIFPVIGIIVMLIASSAMAFEWITLGPEDDGNTVEFDIAGHGRIYHRLEPGESMYYNIDVPDKLRIITRADMRNVSNDEVIYSFRLGYGTGASRLYARATTPDDGVFLRGNANVAGESRIIHRNTPADAERLTISVDRDALVPVFFRVQRDRFETIKQETFVSYTPTRYNNPVELSVRENELTYYGVDPAGNLEVTVNGATVIKTLVRVMMDDQMRREIKFPLAIYEDGVLKRTVLISTEASEVAVLPEHPDRRPTRGDDIYITVPDGQHKYTFDLPENEYEAILRFFIPEKDLSKKAE